MSARKKNHFFFLIQLSETICHLDIQIFATNFLILNFELNDWINCSIESSAVGVVLLCL